MSSRYEQRLENEIDRELKGLPDLVAPHTLILRVMAMIQQRLNLPWYRQAWQRWPIGLQALSMAFLLVAFGGVCFASWKLAHAATVVNATQQVGGWFSGIQALGHAIYLLLTALVLWIKQFGTGVVVACVAALAFGYAMCLGLGGVYLRLGLARR